MKHPLTVLTWVLIVVANVCDPILAASVGPAHESEVTGRIIDSRGHLLGQATVTAILIPAIGKDYIAGTVQTDATGEFTIKNLRAGQPYRLLVTTADLSTANGERTVIAGTGPIDVLLEAAAPVTVNISGLIGVPDLDDSRDAEMTVLMESSARKASVAFHKSNIERLLLVQPEVREGPRIVSSPLPLILIEWLDPDTGAWLPVFSPRRATIESATRTETRASLRFEQVPVGNIRVRTADATQIARTTFDPVMNRVGRPNIIPVRVVALEEIEVKVVNQEGGPASGVRVEISNDSDAPSFTEGTTRGSGSITFIVNPTHDLKIVVTESGKVVSTTSIPAHIARPARRVVEIRL